MYSTTAAAPEAAIKIWHSQRQKVSLQAPGHLVIVQRHSNYNLKQVPATARSMAAGAAAACVI